MKKLHNYMTDCIVCLHNYVLIIMNVHQVLRIYLTVPMSSATTERTFSALRRVKNYLRTTMTQKRLNNVLLLHAHKQQIDDLNLREIATEFIGRNSRRQKFFGSF